MRSDKFEKAMSFLFEAEGGLTDDVYDRGGLTKYGIASAYYPDVDIRNLTREGATAIYEEDYWDRLRCYDMAEPLAITLFDAGVNCGRGSAGKWLQRACNALGSNLKVDGGIGPLSIMEIIQYDPRRLAEYVNSYRLERYSNIVKRDGSQARFLRGWINRVASLMRYC